MEPALKDGGAGDPALNGASPDHGALPALSVIIPTYMRTDVLWRSVERVCAQFLPGDEMLIVDQNIPPLRPPPSLDGVALRLLHLDRPSLTRARNAGIGAARNADLVFLDDDIVPDAVLLESLRRAARRNPGSIVTGVIEQEDQPVDVPTPGWIDLKTGEIRTNFSRPISGEIPFFPGGLSLIPRSALPPPPYFNPAFRGASQGEEIDFSLRARRQGVRIVADPSIRIFHLKAVEGGCRAPEFRRRFFLDHVFNQGLFFGRHGALPHLAGFLGRLKGFVEFHSRKPGGGHDAGLVSKAAANMLLGLVRGIALRVR